MKKLPGPEPSSLFRVLNDFRTNPQGFVLEMKRKYGDFVKVPVPFGASAHLIFHPDLIHDVLVTHADQFQKPPVLKSVFTSSFGNGLFFSEGEFWKRQRHLMQPAFHHSRISAYAEHMVAYTRHTLDGWHDGDTLAIDQQMRALTLTIIVNALFKTDVSSLTEQISAAMVDLGQAVTQQAFSPFKAMLPDWAPLPFIQRKQRGVRTINTIIYDIIEERRKSDQDTGDLLSMLLQARDEESAEQMSDRQVRDELMTLFIAGHETAALTLSWAWVELACHPEAAAKLHAELDRVLGNRPPTLADLSDLPYTTAIIKEVLRMYPAAWLLLRRALGALTIGDYQLPKGAIVWISPYATQRDARWFENPNEFLPERFMESIEQDIPKFAYFPFGGGPRVCIGNGLAMMEAQLILASIAQRFRLVLAGPFEMGASPTMDFKGQVQVQLAAR